jgi:hypothetical protein
VNLFARKSIDELRAQAFAEEEHGLRRGEFIAWIIGWDLILEYLLGIKESARFNNIAVVVKVTVVLMFIMAGGYFLFRNSEPRFRCWASLFQSVLC